MKTSLFGVLLFGVLLLNADEPLIPGQEFKSSLCVWQQKIGADVVVDPKGDKAIDHHASTEFLMALTEWCYPIYYIDGSDPSTYTLEDVYLTTDWHPGGHLFKNVPIPKGVKLMPDATSDGYFCIIDTYHRMEWDFWACEYNSDKTWKRRTYQGRSLLAAKMADKYYFDGMGSSPIAGSAKGSGFALALGAIRPNELKNGLIPHALALSVYKPAKGGPVPPATLNDEEINMVYPDALPDGVKIRLKPDVWTDEVIAAQSWTGVEKTVATALRDYGAYVADNTDPKGMVQVYAENPTYYTNPYLDIDGVSITEDGGMRLFGGDFFKSENFEVIDIRKQLPYEDVLEDYDKDGIPNAAEIAWNYMDQYIDDPSNASLDPDNDGLTNLQEWEVFKTWFYPTNPYSADSDGDGVGDADELVDGTDPTDPFSVNANPSFSVKAFSDVSSGAAPLTVKLSAKVRGGTEPYNYQWDFGDNSTASTEASPSHTYSTDGIYAAKVTVTDAESETTSSSVTINVSDNTLSIDVTWDKLRIRGPNRSGEFKVSGLSHIENKGTTTLGEGAYKVYLSEDNVADTALVSDSGAAVSKASSDILLADAEVDEIDVGESKKVKFKKKVSLATDVAKFYFIGLYSSQGESADPEVESISAGVDLSAEWDQNVLLDDKVKGKFYVSNTGGLASGSFEVQVYFSQDETLDANDTPLLKKNKKIRKLNPGKRKRFTYRYKFDSAPGTGFFIVKVDLNNNVSETDETNNEVLYK